MSIPTGTVRVLRLNLSGLLLPSLAEFEGMNAEVCRRIHEYHNDDAYLVRPLNSSRYIEVLECELQVSTPVSKSFTYVGTLYPFLKGKLVTVVSRDIAGNGDYWISHNGRKYLVLCSELAEA